MGAILAMERNRHLLTVDDIAERAERAARLMAANGVTVDPQSRRCHRGQRAALGRSPARWCANGVARPRRPADRGAHRRGRSPAWRVQISRALLRDAIAAGVDLVGGCPHLDTDPIEANATLLSIAAAAGLPLDLHTDETLDPAALVARRPGRCG